MIPVHLLLAGAIIGLFLAACILVFPSLMIPKLTDESLKHIREERDRLALQAERLKLRNDARTSLLQAVGGAALIAGLFVTWAQIQDNQMQLTAQQDLARRGQTADRFTKAIDELGDDGRLDVRLGGIYGLEQIAKDSHDDSMRWATYDVLAAYVRRHAKWNPDAELQPSPPALPGTAAHLRDRAPDIQAIMTILGRRDVSPRDPVLDLQGVDLRYAELSGARLRGVVLQGAHLEGANLSGADMRNEALASAHLEGAFLYGAHLENAYLYQTNLRGALLREAQLKGARANSLTTWPSGFDWKAAGVIMLPEQH